MRRRLFIVLALLVASSACQRAAEPQQTLLLATIPPLGYILEELAGDSATVEVLLPAGASPHAFEPRPSDARRAQQAAALVYVSDEVDGWAARLDCAQRIALLELVPADRRLPAALETGHEHVHGDGCQHGDDDPHFWTDPLLVRELLPELARLLGELDPEGADAYQHNAQTFAAELEELDREVRARLKPHAGAAVILFHPSLRYLLERYGLELVAVIEPAPGKEPSPAELVRLLELARDREVRALFSEPQLSAGPVNAIAEALALPVYALDPLGGQSGRDGYRELIIYNAETLAGALAGPPE